MILAVTSSLVCCDAVTAVVGFGFGPSPVQGSGGRLTAAGAVLLNILSLDLTVPWRSVLCAAGHHLGGGS